MRLNPAYKAVFELQKKTTFNFSPQVRKNTKDAFYFLIPLAAENTALKIAGKTYQPSKTPHISIYQYYQENEEQGLSVFHYTGYGFLIENKEKVEVILHVYFDRVGRYRNCHLKNRLTKELIHEISIKEERDIQMHVKAKSEQVLHNILSHISNNYLEADLAVDKYLTELDNLSRHLNTQLPKYKQIAKQCIDAMKIKNLWTFDREDPRAKLLADIVKNIDEEFKGSPITNKGAQGFYTPIVKNSKAKKKELIENQEKKPKFNAKKEKMVAFSFNTLQQLADIDKAFIENNENKIIREEESALQSLKLLNVKFKILVESKCGTSFDNELLKVMKQINDQHSLIKTLFEKKAFEGDLQALKCLRSYISTIDHNSFIRLLIKGNIAVCEYLIQNFDVCTFYLNYLVVCLYQTEKPDMKKTCTLLVMVFHYHEDPLFLEMLLKNGANPNFYGGTGETRQGILFLSIQEERKDLVRILLENGADPNPQDTPLIGKQITIKVSDFSLTKLKNYQYKLKNKQPNQFSDNSQFVPLFSAIYKRNIKIVKLLLKHGASVNTQIKEGFDPLGVLTCDKEDPPDLDILKLLIAYGADINAPQMDNQLSALVVACQSNYFEFVKSYVELGANPNQQLKAVATIMDDNNKPVYFRMIITPFLKAAVNGNLDIVLWLMEQNIKPITFTTAAMALAYFQGQLPIIKIECSTLRLNFLNQLPIADLIFKLLISKCYKKETVVEEVKAINKDAKLYYKEQNYSQAIVHFTVVLMFSEEKERLPACFNLACCYKLIGETKVSAELFIACRQNAPESAIARLAEKQLEKIMLSLTNSNNKTGANLSK